MKLTRPPRSRPTVDPASEPAETAVSRSATETFETQNVGVEWIREHGSSPRALRKAAAAGQMRSLAQVRESLRRGRTPHVQDRQLVGGIQALFANAAARLAPRHVGMHRLPVPAQPTDEVALEVFLAPNRHPPKGTAEPAPVASPLPGVSSPDTCADCPFCTQYQGRSILWRGLRVLPNAYPYAPADSQHLLLLPMEHRGQNFEKAFFLDALAFQTKLGPETRMHFNGKAGNSQPHLHWHAHRERLPLEEALASNPAAIHEITTFGDAKLSHFSFHPIGGLLVEGGESSAAELADRVARHLDADPTVQGRYNMVLLQRTGSDRGNVRLAIFPRRSAALSYEAEGVGVIKGGALDMTGRRTLAKGEVSNDELMAWRDFLKQTLVPAAEIPGLERLSAGEEKVTPWQTRMPSQRAPATGQDSRSD